MGKTCTLVSNVDGWRDFHNEKDYGICAIRLARSLRKNGGKCKDMDLVFWYPENNPPPKSIIDELKKLNCNVMSNNVAVSSHEVMTSLEVPSNIAKDPISYTDSIFCTLSACQLEFSTDYTLCLNVDCYIMGDFSGIFQDLDSDLSVMPAQWSFESWCREEDMEKVDEFYGAFGYNRDKSLKTISQVDKKECNFYFYSTAILYKNGIGFGSKYEEAARAVLSRIDGVRKDHLCLVLIQVPIGMVIQKYNLSHTVIPLDLIWNYAPQGHTIIGSPAIVHYQWQEFPGIQKEIWEVKWK